MGGPAGMLGAGGAAQRTSLRAPQMAGDSRESRAAGHQGSPSDAANRGVSDGAERVLALNTLEFRSFSRPQEDVQSEDIYHLEHRLTRIERAIGLHTNRDPECPYPDCVSGLRDCEEMYRALFRENQRNSTTRNFEVSMRKMQTLLLHMRKLSEKL